MAEAHPTTFPSRELAELELRRDPCYDRIPAEDRRRILDAAWEKGADAARTLAEEIGGPLDIVRAIQAKGISILEEDADHLAFGQRSFSDYAPREAVIRLYLQSVALWAEENGLSVDEAKDVILSHEYFHVLEWTELGRLSRDYQVPSLRLGCFAFGKTGVRALSEIGAHGFARNCFELTRAARQ